MADHIAATLDKAREGGAHPAELAALRRRLEQLTEPGAGQLPGDELEPLPDLPRLTDLPEPSDTEARAVLDRLVVLKLNGGLGTSMGLSGPKSLLEIKPGIQSAEVITVKDRGVTRLRGAGRGDLKIGIQVVTPTKLNHKEHELINQFAKSRKAAPPKFAAFQQGLFAKLRDRFLGF